jgi:hypothetical protein
MSRLTPTQFAPRQERDEEKCEAFIRPIHAPNFQFKPAPCFQAEPT